MAFPIKDFSTYFCMVSYAPVSISAEDLKSLHLGVNLKILSKVIGTLYEMFEEEFNAVVKQIMAVYTNDGYESFRKTVIAKCKELSGKNPTFAHFLLVCTLVQVILSDWFKKHSCFLLPRLCFTCLESIYAESYKLYFDSKKEGTNLNHHIEALEKLFNTQKSLDGKKKLPIFVENDFGTKLRNLVKVGNIAPHGDAEQQKRSAQLLHSRLPTSKCVDTEDATESVPLSESFSESTKEPSGISSDKDMNTEAEMEWMPTDEDSLGSMSSQSEYHLSSSRDIGAAAATEDMTMHEDSAGSTRKESGSSRIDENRQLVTRGLLIINNNPSESTSYLSAFGSPSIDANRQVVVQNGWLILLGQPTETTSKLSGQSAGKNVNTGGEMECVPTPDGPLQSTSASVGSSGTETGNWKKDLSYYKNQICEICGGRCGDFMVEFLEGILNKSGE